MASLNSSGGPPVAASLTVDCIKVISETAGHGNISEPACRLIAEDVNRRIRQLIQTSVKFQSKGKRKRISMQDLEWAMRTYGVEPVYGFTVDTGEQGLPFRMASGGGRDIFFPEAEKEVDCLKVAQSMCTSKIPPDCSIKMHWLGINGIQPCTPDNPPPLSQLDQRLESIDPLMAQTSSSVTKERMAGKTTMSRTETMKMKQFATHELSVEQQLYYKEITEACVGSDEGKRGEALASLSFDSGLHQMLPRLTTFIHEGVQVNVVQSNLALLIYLMRMVKALLDNGTLFLEKYLHEILPTVITCIVSRQLCMRPEVDNHWALRDFAARLLAQMSKTYNTTTNNIQTRIVRLLTRAIDGGVPLSSAYGALSGLCEMGPDIQRLMVLPRLKVLGTRLSGQGDPLNPGTSAVERTSAIEHIKGLLTKSLVPHLKNAPNHDSQEDFTSEYGDYLGMHLYEKVRDARMKPLVPPSGPGVQGQQVMMVQGKGPLTTSGGQKFLYLNQSGASKGIPATSLMNAGQKLTIQQHNLLHSNSTGSK